MLVLKAVGLVLLIATKVAESAQLTEVAESAQLKVYTFPEFKISGYVENGKIVGNANMSKANGDFYMGNLVRTENGKIEIFGEGVLIYGINGLIYNGNFTHGYPNGRGSITMSLESPLEDSVLSGCSGCRQEVGLDRSWKLTVDGSVTTNKKCWVIVAEALDKNPVQHAAIFNTNYGTLGFGTLNNGHMDGFWMNATIEEGKEGNEDCSKANYVEAYSQLLFICSFFLIYLFNQ